MSEISQREEALLQLQQEKERVGEAIFSFSSDLKKTEQALQASSDQSPLETNQEEDGSFFHFVQKKVTHREQEVQESYHLAKRKQEEALHILQETKRKEQTYGNEIPSK